MDLVSITDKNKEITGHTITANVTLNTQFCSLSFQTSLISNCSEITLFELVIGSFTATGSRECSKLFPSKDRKDNIGEYMFNMY
jgi:hypothetical protein